MNSIDFLLHTPIAHRGLHNDKAPENSMMAFKAALMNSYPIELDVHLIKSGEVVVFHDNNLKRMCGYKAQISDCSFTELQEHNLGNSREKIPLLTDVLNLVAGRVPLLIELKTDQHTGKLEAAVLEILKSYHGQYALQSFNPLALRYLRIHAPKIPRGQLAGDFSKDRRIAKVMKPILRDMRLNAVAKPDFISYDIRALPQKRVQVFRDSGTPILGWTVKSVTASKEALKHCDNLICEAIL